MTVMNFVVKRHPSCSIPVRSKVKSFHNTRSVLILICVVLNSVHEFAFYVGENRGKPGSKNDKFIEILFLFIQFLYLVVIG